LSAYLHFFDIIKGIVSRYCQFNNSPEISDSRNLMGCPITVKPISLPHTSGELV
jgi:hypothetical protein